MDRITITAPDDWHLHLRDGDVIKAVVAHTAAQFARAIIMPNLKPPVVTTELAEAYRRRIVSALPPTSSFEPLMTLYLRDNTPASEIARAKTSGIVFAVKYYPAGATTNSDSGVTGIEKCFDTLEAMSDAGMPLLIHGEVTDPEIDFFDREKVFIERELVMLVDRFPKLKIVMEHITTSHAIDFFDREKVFIERELVMLVDRFPKLKIVMEHITTSHAIDFVRQAPANVGATITAHHLLLNRNAIFQGGIRPHHYCLPVLKREEHRRALVEAAVSGNPKFFLGTDSAPHERSTKENDCGCAGIYTAHAALAFYAEVFDAAGALDALEAFASLHGADFYGLPRNTKTVTLEKAETPVPASFPYGNGALVPLRAGSSVQWRVSKNLLN